MKKIESSFIFSGLEDSEREIVVKAMEEKSFKPGEYVIKQGDAGENLYVVDTGTLICTKKFVRSFHDEGA